MRTVPADLDDPQVRALLAEHLQAMHANSPPGAVFALDPSALRDTSVTVYCVWQDEALLAIGALKWLSPVHAELKSMRTARAHLRKGAAATLLDRLIAVARAGGCRRLSLETGSGTAFEPALALYRRYGFTSGDAFGDYVASNFNQFMHLQLH
jgi:putative acetyltransferase